MLIKIGEFEFTECWDGVLYKKLSDYPKITDWEKQTVLDFIRYESEYGRTCEIEAEESILHAIDTYRASYEKGNRVTPPIKITECTACPKYKGCMTDLVCHTSPVDSTIQILDCGSLLSPVKARNKKAVELVAEARNAANDPEDYFDYIMFAWGNCQAGDRLVKYSPCQGQSNLTPWKTATNHGRLQRPAMEDRATQGCDLSASWLPRGGAIRYRSFLLHADRRDTGGEPPRNMR